MARVIIILFVGFMLVQALMVHAQDPLALSDDKLIVEGFEITGNNVTKEFVIIRELVFGLGDTIPKIEFIPALQRSKENLLNTSLFNFVNFDARHLTGGRIIVEINVTERWYFWPIPILEYAERNFSEFIKNREWDKLVYGAWLQWNNFRGRGELLSGKIRLGYVNEYALAYDIPNVGRKQQHGFTNGFNINHQNEVNVETVNNQPVEYRPYERPAQIRINAFTKYTFRRKLYSTHTLRMDFLNYNISDSVAEINPDYLGGYRTNMSYFKLGYDFRYDVRDSKVYPLDGFAVKVIAEKLGLGFIPDFAYPSLRLTGVFMFHQPLANRVYFYNATKVRYTSVKHLPHILNQGLGYREFISGYEPYVMDGSDFFISKYNLKFELIRPTSRTIPFIRMEQFNKIHYAIYLNVFADAGYVNNKFPNPTNNMVNDWQFSAGIGLDFVTYYDQVFRIDFAYNKYHEYGFFFHIETPFYRW